MTPRKLKLLIVTFSYGGNGGFKSQLPAVGDFKTKVILAAKKDERIDDKIGIRDLADTPITMSRNAAVLLAREIGADVILMIDSDQQPDMYLGQDPEAVPFFESSFDFLYENYDKFPKGCVIGSPYCGQPVGEENVFVFRWVDFISNSADSNFKLEAYTRSEASILTGIQPCGALPTGLTLWDTRVFELTEPPGIAPDSNLTLDVEKERWKGWFYYEWTDRYASEKSSTEDVTATRNMALSGQIQYGYNPVFCNWSSWAGHYKPKMVGKPQPLTSDYVSGCLRDSILKGKAINERMIWLKPEEGAMNVKTESNGNGHAPKWSDIPAVRPTPAVVGRGLSPCDPEGPEYGQVVAGTNGQQHMDAPEGMILPGNWWTPQKDLDALTRMVLRLAERFPDRPLKILEVGSFVGVSTLALDRGFGPQGGTITCVDTWEGSANDLTGYLAKEHDLYSAFCHNVNLGRERLNITILPIRGKSVEVAASLNETYDLVFIDADRESVKADLSAWLPKVREGGIFCGHDYGIIGFDGVKRAVDETLGRSVRQAGESIWLSMVSHRSHHMLQPEAVA